MGKAEENVSNLQSADLEVRRKAARSIKNAIIGNKAKKRYYTNLGVVKRLIEILSSDTDESIIIQSAAAIGSFACGTDESIKAVNELDAARLFLRAIVHPNTKVVETVARSLKIVFLSKYCNRAVVFEGDTAKLVVALLEHPSDLVKEVAATIIAKSCEEGDNNNNYSNNNNNTGAERRQLYINCGALRALLKLMRESANKTQEMSIEAVAALSRSNEEVCKQFVVAVVGGDVGGDVGGEALVDVIVRFTKDSRPRVRLAATAIISNMNRTNTLPTKYQNCTKMIIPVLIRLFSEETAREDAPQVLARLVGFNEELQVTATEAEAIPKLGTLLQSANATDRLRENTLNALANISSLQDDCRKQIIDHKLLGTIVGLLSSAHTGVRAAACRCTRSLSRSIKQLRTSLVDAGIATPLFKLLDDPSLDVQIEASATLCNIVLDFSPLKREVMENGGLPRLTALLSSMDSTLRLNALWALKNLAYDADLSLKLAIIKEVKFEGLFELMFDTDYSIQEQTLALVRNFVFKDVDIIIPTDEKANELLTAVERLLDTHQNNSARTGVIIQALYLVSNLATGGENIRKAIIASKIARSLPHFMEHTQGSVRVAAVWCATNLGWSDEINAPTNITNTTTATANTTTTTTTTPALPATPPTIAPSVSSRFFVDKLREIGVEEKLLSMTEDPDMDVRDRVNNALCLLEKSSDRMSDK